MLVSGADLINDSPSVPLLLQIMKGTFRESPPNSVKEEDFAAPVSEKTNGLNIEFEAAAFSTFTISWNNAYGNGVKVQQHQDDGWDRESDEHCAENRPDKCRRRFQLLNRSDSC